MMKLPSDENKLITKKWPEHAASPADLKHCASELDPSELTRVTSTHKTINFGQVSVTSTTSKSLAILNELNRCVRVTLDGLTSDLKLSKPAAQVIPGGEVAGFDITFAAKQLGKARRTFSWTINGHHQFTVTIMAEVVPIDLVLKKDLVSLAFPPESTDSSVSENFTILNPGNANAEYTLVVPSNTPFMFRPEKGQIGPGKTTQVSVVWAPKHGRKNDTEVTMDVKYGLRYRYFVYPPSPISFPFPSPHLSPHYLTLPENNPPSLPLPLCPCPNPLQSNLQSRREIFRAKSGFSRQGVERGHHPTQQRCHLRNQNTQSGQPSGSVLCECWGGEHGGDHGVTGTRAYRAR